VLHLAGLINSAGEYPLPPLTQTPIRHLLDEMRALIQTERCLGYDIRATITAESDDDLLLSIED